MSTPDEVESLPFCIDAEGEGPYRHKIIITEVGGSLKCQLCGELPPPGVVAAVDRSLADMLVNGVDRRFEKIKVSKEGKVVEHHTEDLSLDSDKEL